ncbi:cold-shock protein [Rhodospirillales bacterium TMPK1]|uniref:Cold-shock protein n=1 Tax=Roseiterribacter gracilis TaxID=2812848 RepID=A0A8S8XDV4_9PROT|nr:cold-shock protein [Rhodospirillales bacterium TMPK1]
MSRLEEAFDGSGDSASVKTRLKWFNATKGFGFVSPTDGTPDAFLHVSVLHRAGLQEIGEQAELVCEIGQGPKGPQVMRIVELLDQGTLRAERPATARPQRDFTRDSGPTEEMAGTVKWFKPDKGFGFITADDSAKDVFVHKSVLRRCGLNQLEAGQRVQMKVQQVDKGREATWVTPLA